MKTIDIKDAIEIAAKDESLEGFAIRNLEDTQVKSKDALLLARNGILIPEQNILYRDEDVEYDSEFDDYEWTQLPKNITLEELSQISEDYNDQQKAVLNIELEVEDEQALIWAKSNYPILKELFNNVFKGFYTSKSLVDK